MLANLKLAVKRQRKLILIFFLTIFIPSISLSVFGIRAIRNERYHLAKQIENEHRRAAQDLKSQISSQLEELGSLLEDLAQTDALVQQDMSGVKDLLDDEIARNSLVEQVFIAINGQEPFFPLFQRVSYVLRTSSGLGPEASLQESLKRAHYYEFKEKNYKSAISVYKGLIDRSKNINFNANMLANVARCLMKAGDYREAIQIYKRIAGDFPESFFSTGLPLALISRLQMASGYRNLGESQEALNTYLDLYRDILLMQWPLKEAQFKTYASLVEESIRDGFEEKQPEVQVEEYKKEYEQLKILHRDKLDEWEVVEDIKKKIIPELRSMQNPEANRSSPIRYHENLNSRDFLLWAVLIPGHSGDRPAGFLGVKISEQYLIEEVMPASIEKLPSNHSLDVVISRLSGEILLGEKKPSAEQATTTAFFEDNFPPWRIEIFLSGEETYGTLDLKRNFYFWTIITLVLVLISGAVLISRTIAQEMAVLKLKADFVSSVSHEFKSPLTSIKSLAERLRDGKVKDADRMNQYFSVITQDADRLTRLVKNILDFSKIEEGKKEFEFVEADIGKLVTQTIEDFQTEEIAKGLRIQTRISEDIPHCEVDKDALTQALNNLLDNALKFSPERKEIEVTVRRDETSVIIEVKDRGIGIPQNEQDRIFEKFYQGRNAVRQSSKGTGLGLTLVKHTVEAHKGRIEVESQVGEGSSFSIILPIRKRRK